jgi:hypothetical protein
MPKNSHRVAAKQAELRERKRKAAKHSSGIEASMPAAQTATVASVETTGATSATETNATDSPRIATQTRPSSAANPRTHNPYIWPEIKRIGIITTAMMTILAVLTIVLR